MRLRNPESLVQVTDGGELGYFAGQLTFSGIGALQLDGQLVLLSESAA